MPTILVATANKGASDSHLQLGVEVRNIRGALGVNSNFTVLHEAQATPAALIERLVLDRPEILHFAGHSTGEHGDDEAIILVRDDGRPAPMDIESIRRLFASLRPRPRLIFLNSCFSASLSQMLLKYADVVVGVLGAVKDSVARAFSAAFYTYIGESYSVADAFDLAHIGITKLGHDGANFVINEKVKAKSARSLTYFGRPDLMAKFVLGKSGKPECTDGHFSIELFLRGVDQRVDAATYQICHDSYKKSERFYEILRAESAIFLDDKFRAQGDLTIRVTVWSRDRGVGIESTIGQALRRFYGQSSSVAVRLAIESVEAN